MKDIKSLFAAENITEVAFAEAKNFSFIYKHLYPEHEVAGAIVFLIPYYYPPAYADGMNISKYARAKDYHLFATEFYAKILPKLRLLMPNESFTGCCDASPINEKIAAARAGLGVIGKNSLLINPKYGSYCFIGSILTSYRPNGVSDGEIEFCTGCKKCITNCPGGALTEHGINPEKCISAITQKKRRTDEEMLLLRRLKAVWGCDACQDVCPMNKNAAETPVEFFKTDIASNITHEMIQQMNDDEFKQRAFAWRGKNVILQNIDNITEE